MMVRGFGLWVVTRYVGLYDTPDFGFDDRWDGFRYHVYTSILGRKKSVIALDHMSFSFSDGG